MVAVKMVIVRFFEGGEGQRTHFWRGQLPQASVAACLSGLSAKLCDRVDLIDQYI